MRLRFQGLLLFLLIPLAIYLLIAQPLWPLASLIAGAVLLVVVRFAALPHLTRHKQTRCAWSGAEIAPGCIYKVISSGVEHTLHFESDKKRERAAHLLTFAQKYAWPLRVLLIGPMVYYVVIEVLRMAGVEGIPSHQTNVACATGAFGIVILVTSIAHRFIEPIPHMKSPVTVPFAVQVAFLLGMCWTLVAFTLAGLIGVAAAARTLFSGS